MSARVSIVTLLLLLLAASTGCTDTVSLGARDSTSAEAPRDARFDAPRDGAGEQRPGDGPLADDGLVVADGCPPLPSCNWCGGTSIRDGNGCVIGYRCANGVDPCLVNPCTPGSGGGCGPSERCQSDGLCWPDSDAGVTGTFSCGASLRCNAASEYCRADAPTSCSAPPDSGVCPANCKQASCGMPTPQCVCTSYRCEALPVSPCTDCGCLQVTGCNCIATGGGLLVKCQP